MNHGWQSESTDGPKGGWGLLSFSLSFSLFPSLSLSFSLFLWLSTYLPTDLSIYLSIYPSIHPYLSSYLSIFLSFYLSIFLYFYPSIHIYLSIYISIHLSIYQSIYLSFYLSIHPSIQSISLSFYLSIHPYLSIFLSIYLSFYLSIYPSIQSISLSFYLSIHPSISIYLSIYLPIYLSIYLSICKLENEAILRDVLRFWTWQHQKCSNSARLPQCLKLTTSKTKQVCETSSIFELDNVRNEAILRDFFQKWKVECRADGLVPMCFAIFPVHLSKLLPLPRKSDARSYEVLHLSRKIIKLEDLMLQNATPLRKSAPGPPNSSDENVSCTAPATEKASLQILCKMPHACHGFWKCSKILTFCSLLTRCTIPCACDAKRHLNVEKWSEHGVFCTFWLRNVLRATTACTFSTSQLPIVLRTWGVFSFFTCKCASRHNSVHFSISHLARWLRTRRFSEPTFRPSRATNHWKNKVFRDFPTFSRTCIFLLLTLSLLWSSLFYSSLLSDSSRLCFSSVHIVGSLTSKLPSINEYTVKTIVKRAYILAYGVQNHPC